MNSKHQLLALPGYGTNATILQFQLRQVAKILSKQFDFVYLDPPHEVPMNLIEDEKLRNLIPEGDKIYSWNNPSYSVTEDTVMKYSFDYVKRTIKENPNIIGLISFSQGSIMVNLVCEEIQKLKEKSFLTNQIKFVILFSSNYWQERQEKWIDYEIIKVRSLHFISHNDYLAIESLNQSSKYLNPTIIYHSYNHRIPPLDKQQTHNLVNFIKLAYPKL